MTTREFPTLRWAWMLVAAMPCAAMAQVNPAVTDAALERLATVESRLPLRLGHVIYDDARLRAEIKRIGFEKGCHAVDDSRRAVSEVFVPKLVPATVAAIRQVVPAGTLNEMRVLSFVVGPLRVYAVRIGDALDASAGPILESAYAAMRESFAARAKLIPTAQEPSANLVAPKADVAAALGLGGRYDLDNPVQLAFACAELLISPNLRPKISVAPLPQPVRIVPNR